MSKTRMSRDKIEQAIQEQKKLEMENPELVEKFIKHQAEQYQKLSEFEQLRLIRGDYYRLMNEALTMHKYFEARVKKIDEQLNNLEIPKKDDQ